MGVPIYHEGEVEAQERAGVRESSEALGRRMIVNFMSTQHREFYPTLTVLFVASVDGTGRPWASMRVGEPGFIQTPDPTTMVINGRQLAFDPGAAEKGGLLGLLGLEFDNRRRNRMNGRVVEAGEEGFVVKVDQAYGNCPQHIQTRDFRTVPWESLEPRIVENPDIKGLVEAADTFFIATVHGTGLDLSHRGGRPGFVKMMDDGRLVWPDFSGNNMFNTVGNLTRDPRSGYLFADFASGTLLYLSGKTTIQWDGPEVEAFQGAARLMYFEPEKVILVEDSVPHRWDLRDYSPTLARSGSWQRGPNQYRVARKVRESEEITSFYLESLSGPTPFFQPGQHLAVELGSKGLLTRTYSLSNSPGEKSLRISVKRESRGMGSRYLHDQIVEGSILKAHPPSGDFVLDDSELPVVFLSAGVGITPLLSMAHSLRGRKRRAWFIHGARNKQVQAFGQELEQLQKAGVEVHVRHSQPLKDEVEGIDYHSRGRIDRELLRELLPLGRYQFYLCGPVSFLESLHQQLLDLGVLEELIHYEAFGRSPHLEEAEPVEIEFANSEVTATWAGGTLLELAEKQELKPRFSCRSGSCGSCLVPLLEGRVDYQGKPSFEHSDDTALLCRARPAGGEERLVIDL